MRAGLGLNLTEPRDFQTPGRVRAGQSADDSQSGHKMAEFQRLERTQRDLVDRDLCYHGWTQVSPFHIGVNDALLSLVALTRKWGLSCV